MTLFIASSTFTWLNLLLMCLFMRGLLLFWHLTNIFVLQELLHVTLVVAATLRYHFFLSYVELGCCVLIQR